MLRELGSDPEGKKTAWKTAWESAWDFLYWKKSKNRQFRHVIESKLSLRRILRRFFKRFFSPLDPTPVLYQLTNCRFVQLNLPLRQDQRRGHIVIYKQPHDPEGSSDFGGPPWVPWNICIIKRAMGCWVSTQWHVFISAVCWGSWHMSRLGDASKSPCFSKLALFGGDTSDQPFKYVSLGRHQEYPHCTHKWTVKNSSRHAKKYTFSSLGKKNILPTESCPTVIVSFQRRLDRLWGDLLSPNDLLLNPQFFTFGMRWKFGKWFIIRCCNFILNP